MPNVRSYIKVCTRIGVTVIALMASGCANLSPDEGMNAVQDLTISKLDQQTVKIRSQADEDYVQQRVIALLAKPLTTEAAVQIALLNNRGLQAAYNELGISEAQLWSNALPPSPTFSYALLASSGALEIERQIAMNIVSLVNLPQRQDIAETRFRAAQMKAILETLRTAFSAERAFIRAIAAKQTVSFLEKAQLSAETVSELAKKLGETGTLNKLDQARKHVFYAELSAQVATSRLRANTAREALTRSMGLWGTLINYTLPNELKPLPAKPKTLAMAEQEAVRNRVDLAMLRAELDAQAKALDLTESTRFIDVLEVSARDNRQKENITENGVTTTDNLHRQGFNVGLQIPIFDLGETKLKADREAYMQAVNRLIERAVIARSEARQAYTGYRGAYDIARHFRDEVAPLRKIIADEDVLRYNGMLLDLSQLLDDARANVTSSVAGIDALRDFWLAQVDLKAALLGGGLADEPRSSAFANVGVSGSD